MKNAERSCGANSAQSFGCAGLQLDFPNPQNADAFEFWVPFDEEIAVGWT
jgi:hypothetical protein